MEEKKADFRDAAVRESRRLLEGLPKTGTPDPLDSGISYCLPTDTDAQSIKKKIGRATILGLLFGFSGLGGGALIIMTIPKGSTNPHDWLIMAIALCCTLSGFASLFGAIHYSSSLAARAIQSRMEAKGTPLPPAAIPIELEDAASVARIKSVPEDTGYVITHPDLGFLQIEGLSHQYVVWAEDVVGCHSVLSKYSEMIFLDYKVGDTVLKLVVKPRSLSAHLKRQTIGGESALETKIRLCLHIQ